MVDVLVFGDSHVAALYKGQQSIEADAEWPDDVTMTVRPLGGGHLTREPFFADRGDHVEITTPEYRRNFERLPVEENGSTQTIYGISAPLHSVRVWRNADWRKFAPRDAHLPGIPISDGMLKRVILDDQKYVLELIKILLRNGKHVFVIEPPHPFRHHPALRGTAPELAVYLNEVYRGVIRRELDAIGVPVVSVPAHCLDGGFMRDRYAKEGDPHHGNVAYGRLMIEEVLRFLKAPAEWPLVPAQDDDPGIESTAVASTPAGRALPAETHDTPPRAALANGGAPVTPAAPPPTRKNPVRKKAMTLVEPAAPKIPSNRPKIVEEFATLARLHAVKGPTLEIMHGARANALSLAPFLADQERHVVTRGEGGEFEGVAFHKTDPNDMTALFDNACFGTVFWDRALEHDAAFWLTLAEIKRVLVPGGVLIVCTRCYGKSNKFGIKVTGPKGNDLPFLTATSAATQTGADYWRISPQGMRAAILKGFDVREVRVAFMAPHLFGVGVKPDESA